MNWENTEKINHFRSEFFVITCKTFLKKIPDTGMIIINWRRKIINRNEFENEFVRFEERKVQQKKKKKKHTSKYSLVCLASLVAIFHWVTTTRLSIIVNKRSSFDCATKKTPVMFSDSKSLIYRTLLTVFSEACPFLEK